MRFKIQYRGCGQVFAETNWSDDAYNIIRGMLHITPMWFDVLDTVTGKLTTHEEILAKYR